MENLIWHHQNFTNFLCLDLAYFEFETTCNQEHSSRAFGSHICNYSFQWKLFCAERLLLGICFSSWPVEGRGKHSGCYTSFICINLGCCDENLAYYFCHFSSSFERKLQHGRHAKVIEVSGKFNVYKDKFTCL